MVGVITGNTTEDRDRLLVSECLSGSERAWNQFYCRYIGLVRSIIRRHSTISPQDIEDVIQIVFTSLIRSLKDYDRAFPLPKFIFLVAERVCIQEFRRTAAAKRKGETDPVDHHDSGKENARILHSELLSQEQLLARGELLELMRHAMRSLGFNCRELLRLRYLEELPYKEIVEILGASENTLNVQTRRCLDQLGINYRALIRNGPRR